MVGMSVIIPAYEAWPLLQRTLASIILDAAVLEIPFEVVIVDNESDRRLAQRVSRHFGSHEIRVHRRTDLGGVHFQPGSARNIGIEMARYDSLVFLDADCIPSAQLLSLYARWLELEPDAVLVGHRVFVDCRHLSVRTLARDRHLLDDAQRVASASNYGRIDDRRLRELERLDSHARPYDCLFACNFAIRRRALADLRFDCAFDGRWGYEDIELGFRLFEAGRTFRYLPDAYVFHQEDGPVAADHRAEGRAKNFPIAAAAIPGFAAYRASSSRPAGSSPDLQVSAENPPTT